MAVMNADTGKVITTLPIGDRVDAVAFDADNKLIFCSNGDGTISVIHQKSPDEYESVGDIQTQESAKTMALDPKIQANVSIRGGNGPAARRSEGPRETQARQLHDSGGGAPVTAAR